MADQWGERMPRTVGLLQTVAVSVGVAIGSGIFRVPATVAGQLGTPGPILLCWVLGGIIALCGALTVAELAGAMPRSGGIFAYLLEAYGPLPAFLFGWTELVVIRASALGAIATIFAEYVGYFVPLTALEVRYVAAATIIVIGAINYVGVQRAALLQSATTVLKYAALLALGLLAFTASGGSGSHFSPAWPAGISLSLLATALAFTVQAWAQRITSATHAALIYALEPVVAGLFSFIILRERLPAKAIFGAGLILIGILVAELKPIGAKQHPSL